MTSFVFGFAGLAQAQTREPAGPDAFLLACQQMLPCRSHLAKAAEFQNQDRPDQAIEEYKTAYSLQPYPPILYNIARLQHKQKHLAEAAVYYQRYLDSSHPERAERAKQLLSQAQEALASEQSKPAPAPLQPAAPPALATPAAPVAPSPPITAIAPAERHASQPTYKKWWVWTLVGVAAVGAATAVGIGVYASGPDVTGLLTKSAKFGQ